MGGKYINPFTDFGFKKLFGEEANKDILRDFLNELLREEQGEITGLRFLRNDNLGAMQADRKAIFDIYCESARGEKFIVEMQKAKQDFFKDRSVFYSTFPIRDQAERGDWNYELNAIYTIGILDFVFQDDKDDSDKFIYRIKLSDIETNKVFYDKLTFMYLEMPKFRKKPEECVTHFERWLYLLRHLSELEDTPAHFDEGIFAKLFGEAEIARFDKKQLMAYDESLKYYRDLKNSVDTAREEGEKVGIEKGERTTLLRILRKRFGEVALAIEKKVADAPVEQIEAWIDAALDADALQQVFPDV
ncbi:MAG: Rpn family recombination-promoting nuclease/putative transposase [Bacteroidia bacterium]|nr:Rpn family recombination-promoting nuclease/putative transposase [Bacteroidia bacterium]